MSEHTLPEAKDLGQAILLLSVLGANVAALTNEIRTLRSDMATRDELYQVRDALNSRMDALRAEVHGASTPNRIKRWAEAATDLGKLFALGAGVVGALYAIVHFWDRLPK